MDELVREEIITRKPYIPKMLILILLILILAGFAAFISNIMSPNPNEAWQIYLVNFLFFTGVAQGGIIFSCIMRITNARWARPLLRISEGLGSFLPVSLVLLIVLFLGKDYVLPYATQHYHHPKDIWLNIPFVISRDVGGFIVLLIISLFYLYFSLRQDLGGLGDKLSGLSAWIASGWSGEQERQKCWKRLGRLAPAIILVYIVVFSLLAWDLIMSLDPYWFSTLFGPYFFIECFIASIGATIIFSVFVRKSANLQDYITKFQYYDMGKLLLGFSLFWVYLFFSQYLPIWYANMPEETGFVFKRVRVEPFNTLSWFVLSSCFIFPFVTLLPKTNKVVIPVLVFIASVSFTGFWIEKFVLVMPSFAPEINFGTTQILITLGFLSAFISTFLLFIKSFPIIPVGDPFFGGKANSGHGGH